MSTHRGSRAAELRYGRSDAEQMAGRVAFNDRWENWRAAAKTYMYARPILLFWLRAVRLFRHLIFFPFYWAGDWLFLIRTGLGRDIYRRQPDSLTIRGPHAPDANEYATVHPKWLRRALSTLAIDYSRYVFIDCGSGKGVAVLMASQYHFKSVIGVEFARELHEAAQNNLKLWRPAIHCGSVEFVWADVLEFKIPLEPCVMFFYAPFGAVILCRVLERVRESMRIFPRDFLVVYINPSHVDAILAATNPEILARSRRNHYAIFRMRLPS